MAEHRYTYCRICESACGLIATVDGDAVLALRPDAEHPASKGYACKKGVQFDTVHHAPHRCRKPQWRADTASSFAAVSWREALDHTGSRLRALLDEHGPAAVGVYSGNAAGHSLGPILGTTAFLSGLKTQKHYSALSLDNAEMYVVTEACLGNPMLTFVADYVRSDLLVLIGTDPLSSQPSQAQSNANGVREILQVAQKRDLVVIDPRRSNTARKASLHLQPRPGSDAALLAFLIREVLVALPERTVGDELLDSQDVRVVREAVEPWDATRTANATGLHPAALHTLLERLLQAKRPLVWSGLGVLLGPDGTVGYWLTLVLQAVLGGLDRAGGWLLHRGAVDLPALLKHTGVLGYDRRNRSRKGNYPAVLGTWASATLADDVLDEGPDRLRALIVVGGNPARSLPDGVRAREALQALELLVVLDIQPSATTELAHAVLPATSWLARGDLTLHQSATSRQPNLQYTDAVVGRVGEARDDWEILLDLTRAAGRRPFGSVLADWTLRTTGVGHRGIGMSALSLWSPRVAWQLDVKRGLFDSRDTTGDLRKRKTDLPHGGVCLAVPEFVDALRRSVGFEAPDTDLTTLQVITSVRSIDQMNSWIPGRARPVCRAHPDDLASIGSESIQIRQPGATEWQLALEVVPDTSVLAGVLVLPWGFDSLDVNTVIGTERLEPFTGQPISNGSWVEVRRNDRTPSDVPTR